MTRMLFGVAIVVLSGCTHLLEPAEEPKQCQDGALFEITQQCISERLAAGCDQPEQCPDLIARCDERIEQWEKCR